MKKLIIFTLVAVLMLGVAGCKNSTSQTPTSEPEASYPSLPRPTAPEKDENTETEPEVKGEVIKPNLPIAENMICDAQYGETFLTVHNPTASHIYNYLIEQKKAAKEENPADPNKEYSEIQLLFRVNGEFALRIRVYSDDYAAIHKNADASGSPADFYKFPAGTYQSLLLTLQEQNGGK